MVNMMQRMEEIRSRIEEIRSLGKGKSLSASPVEGVDSKTSAPGSSSTASTSSTSSTSPQATEFALLLQEAAGLLEGQSGEDGNGFSQSLLGPLLGLEEDDAFSGMGLTGVDSVKALLEKSGASASVGNLGEGLLSKALEAYKKQNE